MARKQCPFYWNVGCKLQEFKTPEATYLGSLIKSPKCHMPLPANKAVDSNGFARDPTDIHPGRVNGR